MKNLPNIEKSAFRKGEYVGHCKGAQRIRKTSDGWQTYALGSSAGVFVACTASTLAELSAKLDSLNDDSDDPTSCEHVPYCPPPSVLERKA